MKRILVALIGLTFSLSGLSQGLKDDPTKPIVVQPECPPCPTCPTCPTCKPCPPCPKCDGKVVCPEGCVPKPKQAKVKPRPKAQPATKVIYRPRKCPEPKVVEKVVEKTKYIDRTVTVDNTRKNAVYFLLGRGPDGLVTDRFKTKDRDGEFAVRESEGSGAVFGLQYVRHLSTDWSATGIILSNPSFLGGVGYHW